MKNCVPLFLMLVCGSANAALYSCADENGSKVLRSWPCEEVQPHLMVRTRVLAPPHSNNEQQSLEDKILLRSQNFSRIKVGMSVDEVYRILGKPERVNVTSSSGGKSEQMIYETGSTQEEIRAAIVEELHKVEIDNHRLEATIRNSKYAQERQLLLQGASRDEYDSGMAAYDGMTDNMRAEASATRIDRQLKRRDGLASNPGYIYVTDGKVVSIQQTRH